MPPATGAARVLVTRPAREAAHWVQALRQTGFQSQALPLIEIAPVTSAAAVAQLGRVRQSLSSYDALMFVSVNAVTHFFKGNEPAAQYLRVHPATDNVAPTAFPGALRCLAPGPGTAAALLAAGVPYAQIDAPAADAAQYDSQALWQAVGPSGWLNRRVLVLHGQSQMEGGGSSRPGQRDWLTRQWQNAGAVVDHLSVYQRCAPRFDAVQLALAQQGSADGTLWLFSSTEAFANLMGHPGLSDLDWRKARAVATHPRIADVVRAGGWGVVTESRPALNDILHTLRSIESAHP